jgi:hypothetical protein
MVGLKAAGVRQVRHAEQADLVRHDQGGHAQSRPDESLVSVWALVE